MAAVQKPIMVVKKDKSGYNYKYVSEAELLSKITAPMQRNNITLETHIKPGTLHVEPYTTEKNRVLKDGTVLVEKVNEVLVYGEMEYHFVNNLNPEERIIIPWFFVGQQADASQAFGSALSYSKRYFLLNFFNAARDDDPEQYRARQKEAELQEERSVTEALIEQIDSYIQGYLQSNPKDNAKIGSFLKKHIKIDGKPDTNYFAIQSSAEAASLYAILKETFTNKEEQ